MELYKRFLLLIAAAACAAGAVCGVIIAKANTERRLYGDLPAEQETAIAQEEDGTLSLFSS